MKKFTICILVGLLSFSVNSAQADLTLYAVDGDWSNPVGATVYVTYNNGVPVGYGNGLQDQIRFGDTAPSVKSGLGFTGVAPPSSSFAVGAAFEIGQLTHINNPIPSGTGISAADLTIKLTFSADESFSFTFGINETSNEPGPPLSDDIISFPSSYAPQSFDIDGEAYTLQLLGFGPNAGSLLDEFQSPEGGSNNTLLWGRITPVPVPGTVLLGAMGLGMVGWMKRRKDKAEA